MGTDSSDYRGCLLGLAVGDALGYGIDDKTWEEIRADYGPNGLLGYDLQDEYAAVTSHTQIAAYVCNALLLSIGRPPNDSRLPYVTLGLKEWTRSQQFYRDPEKSFCWIAKLPAFRRRSCRDIRMLDTLRMQSFGTPDAPANGYNAPGALTEAVAIGMFYSPQRMTPNQVGELAAKAAALTHGSSEAILSGVVLAYSIAGILQEPDSPLEAQFRLAVDAMQNQFPGKGAQALSEHLQQVFEMAKDVRLPVLQAMEQLHCTSAGECLAGAMYASLVSSGDFDRAMISAINHSGRSAAVGAVTGAILGAKLGIEALPDFYVESIEPRNALSELSEDMLCSMPATGLFDDDWDQKYVQGQPL